MRHDGWDSDGRFRQKEENGALGRDRVPRIRAFGTPNMCGGTNHSGAAMSVVGYNNTSFNQVKFSEKLGTVSM